MVLSIAIYGSIELIAGNGVGIGQRLDPADIPERAQGESPGDRASSGHFTYRWPEYGGVETPHLVLPVNENVELNVTSLDVIHSFWAYQLGVKADANPDVNNIAFVKPTHEQTFEVRCAELCGIWHGAMFDHGQSRQRRGRSSGGSPRMQVKFRAGDQDTAAVREDLPTRTDEARRMSTTTESAASPAPTQRPLWRRLIGFNLLTAVILAVGGYYLGWLLGHQIGGAELRIPVRGRRKRRRAPARLRRRRDRLPGRPRLRQLPRRTPAGPARLAARERARGDRALLRALHRPQGRRDPVPGGDRRLLLHRRPERDADQARAHPRRAHRRRAEPVPVDRRHPRLDDDGHDDLGDPGAVRQLLRADHDRRPADGLPPHRGAHVLAADGRRFHPHVDDLLRGLPDRLDGL